MKKFMRTIALALVMAMMMGITAFAAPKVEEEVADTVDAKFAETGEYAGKKLDELTYSDGKIVKDGQYMIFVVNKEDGSYLPTASSILYINQKQAEGNGTITFKNVFPKAMLSSGIMISGTNFDVPTLIAMILAGKLGDVDKDGAVTVLDAIKILQFIVDAAELDDEAMDLGNVDGQGTAPDVLDAIKILRFIIGAVEL